MIHVVTHANAGHYAAQIEEMFRLRHEFYVERNGWRALDRGDGLERDEFDHEHTVYLLHLDDDDRLLGSYRLCPSLSPTLLFSKFAAWIDDPNVRPAADIWDLSRWFLTERARRTDVDRSDRVQAELACGIFEFALTRGISAYAMFSETRFYEIMVRSGWPARPLGLPRPYDDSGASAIAVRLETSLEALETVRALKGLRHPVLYEAPPPAAAIDSASVRDAAQMLEAFYAVNDRHARVALIAAAAGAGAMPH
jgi:acyl-homoserine lactone synthase